MKAIDVCQRVVLIPVLLVAVFSCSGNSGEKTIKTEDKVNDSTLAALKVAVNNRVAYQLSDVGREGKNVGWVYSNYSFSAGSLIFLGDDIWEVVGVKAFTAETFNPVKYVESVQNPSPARTFSLTSIELLVRFAGKATDPKP